MCIRDSHVPEADVNLVAFTNKKADEVQGFQAKIEKEISDDDEPYSKNGSVKMCIRDSGRESQTGERKAWTEHGGISGPGTGG